MGGPHDRSIEFRDCCAKIRQQDPDIAQKDDITSSLLKSRTVSPFTEAATHVHESIVSMETFLKQHHITYIGVAHSPGGAMSMDDRDALEKEVRLFSDSCTKSIDALKAQVGESDESRDCRAHRHTLVLCLFAALQKVTEAMRNMKLTKTQQTREQALRRHPSKYVPHETKIPTEQPINEGEIDTGFSKEEELAFEAENADLIELLDDDMSQARKAEKALVEISQAVSLFSEKVMEQEEQIKAIYETSVKSVSHVESGTKELQKALQRNVSFRVSILFFLATASLSLLFLDWYM